MKTSSHQLGPARLWDGLPPSGEWRGEAAVSWRCTLWAVSAVVLGGGVSGGGKHIISSSRELSATTCCVWPYSHSPSTKHEHIGLFGVTSDGVTTYTYQRLDGLTP